MNKFEDLTKPYKKIDSDGIQYGYCREFDHISRYKGLRQITHSDETRFITLELVNNYQKNVEVVYHVVTSAEEDRLDLIAHQYLGSSEYSWVIAQFNEISDGYTVHEGTVLQIPVSITSLFRKGEVLASVSPFLMNLGEE